VKGRKINNRRFVVKQVMRRRIANVISSFSAGAGGSKRELLQSLKGAAVLTVGESDSFLRKEHD